VVAEESVVVSHVDREALAVVVEEEDTHFHQATMEQQTLAVVAEEQEMVTLCMEEQGVQVLLLLSIDFKHREFVSGSLC
jgi:hypothetical protein